ncbi:hypothetical protein M2146_002555 [Lachnospiraceae bacterium PF1-22]
MKIDGNYMIFENYNELLEHKPQLAQELSEEKSSGEWQTNEICYYENLEAFAEYELTEGWYAELNLDREYNGAPDPMDFINLEALGEALSNSWDEKTNFLTESDEVLTTSYGW